MALPCHETVVRDDLEEKWKFLGRGGFGCVYKARHKGLMFDVAIKLLNDDVRCSSSTLVPKEKELSKEVNHMDRASCEYVLRVYGFFEGIPPIDGFSMVKGIVMEYMDRGSLETLLEELSGPPPWPLAFRLAHEVALGMNFLHSRKLVHQDLKTSNVLLTDEFHAKLSDFGLSRVSISASNSNRETTGEEGGSYKYMPPEALLDISYVPSRAFDRYSYGIFLWSLFTGKEPYPNAQRDLVEHKVGKQGQRPPCNALKQETVEGLDDLVKLMNSCWDQEPSKRPTFKECLEVTEMVFLNHKDNVRGAVDQVLFSQNPDRIRSVPPSIPRQTPEPSESDDTVDGITARFSTQELDSGCNETMSDKDKAKFVDDNKFKLFEKVTKVTAIIAELGDMIHSELHTDIAVTPKPQEKMRILVGTILRSNVESVTAAFYNALKKHEPGLVKELDG
ncbi:receptor-interacting serine/threonine-protein kinase 3-like isoform X2 [Seriola lalandi dorsalis]|uniref:receptor-interacting serine/threonine-protein kinase 3-like n=1 Tax=Seriola aureovittata TaxID=2871759 RepID=UPI000C6FC60D|nr:receptor-interacting serine/threonine-protein kinase 3-like isoform X2 [Seriola lalandi dorsalis]XP_056243362.1 receptor-interacting serine/threonine-protein kinase 3-like [Seriola aureovittata]